MIKEIENVKRIRKIIRKKAKFVLPKSRAIQTKESLEYAEKETQTWFDSLRGKSQCQITDSIFVESW